MPWIHAISDFNRKEIVGTFYEKYLQKANQKDFRVEKVLKKRGNKIYVKWKGINEWMSSENEIFWSKCKSWISLKIEVGLKENSRCRCIIFC